MSYGKIVKVNEIQVCKVPVEEQEYTISKGREDRTLEIFANDNTFITKLKKAMKKNPDIWECREIRDSEGEVAGYFFEAPKSILSVRSGAKTPRKSMSEEHKQKLKEALKRGRESKKSKKLAKDLT